jgi:hypothetical protein
MGCEPGRLLLTFQTVDRYHDALSIQILAYIIKMLDNQLIFCANTK